MITRPSLYITPFLSSLSFWKSGNCDVNTSMRYKAALYRYVKARDCKEYNRTITRASWAANYACVRPVFKNIYIHTSYRYQGVVDAEHQNLNYFQLHQLLHAHIQQNLKVSSTMACPTHYTHTYRSTTQHKHKHIPFRDLISISNIFI
jgi:hypothetical protein